MQKRVDGTPTQPGTSQPRPAKPRESMCGPKTLTASETAVLNIYRSTAVTPIEIEKHKKQVSKHAKEDIWDTHAA
jgi:hypothetical protein